MLSASQRAVVWAAVEDDAHHLPITSDPTDLTDPTEPTEPNELTDSTDPSDPTDPTDPTCLDAWCVVWGSTPRDTQT